MFKRVSLTGSAELFKDTTTRTEPVLDPVLDDEAEPERELELEPIRVHTLPIRAQNPSHYTLHLTEPQVRTLIDALQTIKYPHTVKSAAKLSMEEFERLEALRQVLLDGLR